MQQWPRRALLVIAHPDDEAMFFAPTLQQLAARGVDTAVLCLSTGAQCCLNAFYQAASAMIVIHSMFSPRHAQEQGSEVRPERSCRTAQSAGNAAGLGEVRSAELVRSCGVLGVRF